MRKHREIYLHSIRMFVQCIRTSVQCIQAKTTWLPTLPINDYIFLYFFFISVYLKSAFKIFYSTVSHLSYAPLFQGPHFFTKMLDSNILYDNLFIDILSVWYHRKKILESLMRIILLLKGNFNKFWKKHLQAERLNFLFLFCARHYPWWSLWQKNTQNILFIQVKPLFSVVEFSNTVTFWRNARFNVILTSVTIIKLGFLCKLLCYESLVDIEVSKH